MNILFMVVDIISALFLISAIYNSQSRWAAFGYAVVGFVIPMVLGLLLMFIAGPGSIDTIGAGMTLACPIAAAIGTLIPPTRKHPQAL